MPETYGEEFGDCQKKKWELKALPSF